MHHNTLVALEQKLSTCKKISIIGAGASGLLCAIYCAKSGIDVDVYEQNSKVGKKILVSGNGRCNITNENLSKSNYFSQDNNFVEFALNEFGFDKFNKFCTSIGLVLDVKNDGKTYPLSNEAKSVVSLLHTNAINLGVNFFTDTKVTDIKEMMSKYYAVVVATGSEAASHLGGNRDGLEFGKVYGHNIIDTYPSLVQFEINSKLFKKIAGAKVNGEVSLLINNQLESTKSGDILFTNYGVSGFAILDISQSASIAIKDYQSVQVSLNLLPSFNEQQLSRHILSTIQNTPSLSISDILSGLLPIKIVLGILESLSIDVSTKEIHTKLSKKISNTILKWRFNIEDTHGFRHAEVAGGGIDVSEINSKTMESQKQKNLYFCGEVLDVLGQRGGYNFAWAWASGYIAAQSIIAK